ncbi:MAG: FAD-binding protein [Actinomycetota bacterium]
MASKRVIIYGAGMSGLIAACNLAGEGREVVVREQEPSYGGSHIFNPSLHTTPLDPQATSEYIGIDITPAFVPVSSLAIYLHDFRIDAPVFMAYHVERSDRPSSLDTLLYNRCLEAGVSFEFETPLRREDIASLPEGTIIACGLNRPAYDYLGIPYKEWFAWRSFGVAEHDSSAWIWMDECINEYGYISYANGMYYNLLFAYGQEIDREGLEKYRDFMRRVDGLEEDRWDYIVGAAPVVSPDNPCLFRDGLIMCGTMSGCLDPFMGFGISGALVSGKVAAIAVSDRAKAAGEFARFTRNYPGVFNFKQEVWYPLRERVDLLEGLARTLGHDRSVRLLLEALRKGRKSSAIPGFSPLSCS